jgi:hypothetical protein
LVYPGEGLMFEANVLVGLVVAYASQDSWP